MIKLLERFSRLENALIVEELMPETGIEKVENSMFSTADIDIDRKPVIEKLLITDCLIVMGIDITGIIPRGTCPLRHGIGLS